MIELDANVLVRFLVRDDDEQFARAEQFPRRSAHAGEPVYVSMLVLLETEWVLRSRYKLEKSEILGAFSELRSSVDLSFEDEPSVEEALFLWKESPAQFADCLIGARHRALGCAATATFDSDALKLPGWIGEGARDPQGSRRWRGRETERSMNWWSRRRSLEWATSHVSPTMAGEGDPLTCRSLGRPCLAGACTLNPRPPECPARPEPVRGNL